LALTQGLQQAFVRAVFANAPGCPGVAPLGWLLIPALFHCCVVSPYKGKGMCKIC